MGADDQSALWQQFARNPFRVLGLPGNASQKAILERAAALDRAVRVGVRRPPSPWNLEWCSQSQHDRSSIADALGRLNNSRQRLSSRLFWISQSEIFVADISPTTIDNSVAALRSSLLPADHHDAAVLALAACFMKDAAVQDADHWRIALQMWTNLVESEEFWSGFWDVEELGDFEPSASVEDFDQLKAESLQLAIEPIAQLAREAASRSEFDRCRRALKIVHTALPSEMGSALEESVFGPYEDNLVRNSKEITKRCWADIRQDRASAKLNEKPCEVAVDRWKQELEPRYRDFVAMAGTRSVAALHVRQEYGDFLAGLGNALTWADHWVEAERLMSLALSCLPPDSPARERIEGAISRFSGEASRERERERTRQQELELGLRPPEGVR